MYEEQLMAQYDQIRASVTRQVKGESTSREAQTWLQKTIA